MTQKMPRVSTIPPEQWSDAAREAVAAFSQPLSEIGKNPAEDAAVYVPNVMTTLVQHPALAKAFLPFSKYLLQDSSLPDRSRELMILRVAWLRQCEYEWAQHVLIGKNAGLTDDEIEDVRLGADQPAWAPTDRLLVKAVDELHESACISDQTWEQLSAHLDLQQMMELVFTVGAYDMLAMAFNSFGLALDQGMKGFDQ